MTTKTKTTKGRKPRKAVAGQILKRVGDKKHVVDLSHYSKAKSAAGNTSLDSGDAIAKQFRGAELDDVYKAAAKVLKVSAAELVRKYKHLNVGMQRMNLGNRIRGAQAE